MRQLSMAATLAVLLAAVGAARTAQGDGPVCAADAKPANLDFTLKDVDGRDVRLSDYRGQVILLDFWATWCAPCKVEIPGFVDLYARYRSQGFVVLGVSVDDPVEKMKPFVSQFKMNYPVLVGLGHEDLQDAFGPLMAFPTAFVISREGKVCARHSGLTPKSTFEREIKALL